MSMNETVYLFALSVPDLLEALVANQDRSTTDTRPHEQPLVGAPRAPREPRLTRSGEDLWQ
jgi:hypothetical protein